MNWHNIKTFLYIFVFIASVVVPVWMLIGPTKGEKKYYKTRIIVATVCLALFFVIVWLLYAALTDCNPICQF